MIAANDPSLKSWIEVESTSDFPIQNLPFGVFKTKGENPRIGSRIGDKVIDLDALYVLGYFKNLPFNREDFKTDCLNHFMKKGKGATSDLRNRLSKLFDEKHTDLSNNTHHCDQVLIAIEEVEMLLPIKVGDYTDFYSSRYHAENVGTLFRGKDHALKPNYLHLPVGYHGRASSIVPSGQAIKRPLGQHNDSNNDKPVFGPSKRLDFELEMAFVTFDGKPLGERISTSEAEEYIFGMCLMNDWSARDIQKWEYVPLGPFLGKNFATSISPWIVTLDALTPYKTEGPKQVPEVLPYLKFKGNYNYDVNLEVSITPEGEQETVISRTNYKYMYWNIVQHLAHHTINGCNIRCGDLMASGTISGPEKGTYGSMLEISWNGEHPISLVNGEKRAFIEDHDAVSICGHCTNGKIRIGFGKVMGKILPADQ